MRILSRYVIVLALLLFWNIICAEATDNEFEMMDGIRVRKDSINVEMNDVDKKGQTEGKRETDSDGNEIIKDDQDDDEDDDDDNDNDDDDDDSEDEDLESTKHLPTKCHGKQVKTKDLNWVIVNGKMDQTFSPYSCKSWKILTISLEYVKRKGRHTLGD